MKYREIIFMISDELKMNSDDAYFTEDHIKFLVTKYRNQLIKQQYQDVKKTIPNSYYQCVTMDLEDGTLGGGVCAQKVLKTKKEMPSLMQVAPPQIFAGSMLDSINIALVSPNRLRFVGENKWMNNIIYAAKGPGGFLYVKSSNPQFADLEKISVYGVFEDPEAAENSSCCECGEETPCDILDRDFPIEDALVPTLIQYVVKELLGALYRPADGENNSSDDLSSLANFLARNAKSSLQKQIEGDE